MRRAALFFAVVALGACGGDTERGLAPPDNSAPPDPVPIAAKYTLTTPPALSGYLVVDLVRSSGGEELFLLDSRSREIAALNREIDDDARVFGQPVLTADLDVVFMAGVDGETGIYRFDRASGTVAEVVSPIEGRNFSGTYVLRNDREIAWSAVRWDGTQIKWVLYVARIDGSLTATEVQSPLGTDATPGYFTLSPDGVMLYWYEEFENRIVLVRAPVDDVTEAELVHDHGPGFSFPSSSLRVGNDGLEPARHIQFLRDGRLMYGLYSPGTNKYFILDPEDPELTPLPFDPPLAAGLDVTALDFHELPEGRTLYSYRAGTGSFSSERLIIGDLADPDAERQVNPEAVTDIRGYRISSDGRWIAYVQGHNSALHLADLAAAVPESRFVAMISSPTRYGFDLPERALMFLNERRITRADLLQPEAHTMVAEAPEGLPYRYMKVLEAQLRLQFFGNTNRYWIGPLRTATETRPLILEPPTEFWREQAFLPLPE
ncbi:MAG: hypothetical protein WD081_03290 [Gammaproteobacteria bacterium]